MERVMAIVTSKLGDTVMNEKVKILELFLFFWLYGIWDLKFPNLGLTLWTLQWEHESLTTGLPGKSWFSGSDEVRLRSYYVDWDSEVDFF